MNLLNRFRPCAAIAASASITALFSTPAYALISSWNTNSNGLFTAAANWNNGVPDIPDTATFNRGSGITYTVTFPGSAGVQAPPVYKNDRLLIRSNAVSFVRGTGVNGPSYVGTNTGSGGFDPGIVIGQLNGDNGRLTTAIPLSAPMIWLARDAGSTGRLDLTAHTTASVSDRIQVGYRGNGTLSIDTGAQLTMPSATGILVVGSQPGATGTLNVDGAGSSVSARTLEVAPFGNGSVLITGGGQASFEFADITGFENGTNGSIAVDGAGSTWTTKSGVSMGVPFNSGDIDPATLTVTNGGTVTMSGQLTVGSSGTVAGDGTIQATSIHNAGVIRPGATLGPLHVTGGVTQVAGGKFQMQLGGTDRATQYDSIEATAAVHLAGEIDVTLSSGFMPAAGQSFDVIDGSSIDGSFSVISLPALSSGLMWNASRLTSDGTLSVQVVGDYNGNGVVDAADYVLWRKSPINQVAAGLPADGNGNFTIDAGDYTTWRSHFGQTAGSSLVTDAVPEPRGVLLLVIAAISWRSIHARRLKP